MKLDIGKRQMISRLNDVSLRAKIMVSFVLIVLGGTAVSTLIGSRIIAKAMLNEGLKRVRNGLDAASVTYTVRQENVSKSVLWAASAARLVSAAGAAAAENRLPQIVDSLRIENGLHFLCFVDTRRGMVVHSPSGVTGPPAAAEMLPYADFIAGAVSGNVVAGTEVLGEDSLRIEAPRLVDQGALAGAGVAHSGLVLLAAVPVRVDGATAGVLYGGILLNRNQEIVDQIKQVIFGGEQSASTDMGTVSILLDASAISTNAGGSGAAGLPADASRAVLTDGERWYGRVASAGGWSIAACGPLRNHAGKIVGILLVSALERPFLAVRTDMMLTFLVVAAAGVLIVLGLTYLITRSMIHPLEEIVAASKCIAAGDLDHSVNVRSSDEIGLLAHSFNEMVASLKTMKLELEEWGGTLEEKVQKRTEELVTVQAQMAQSAKMASLGRLAAGVAHEINNPLGGILTFSMLALEDCDEKHPLRQNLEIIVKQTLRCRETVKGLLDFARQSSQAASNTDINSVVEKTLSLLEGQSMFQNIRTVRKFDPELPAGFIDAGQLQQVVVNIVLNAVDAMEQSGTLTVETLPDGDGREVLLRISDTGPGIPDDVLPYIFEPFFTTKKVGHGTGLGLSIVHGIVTRVGGKVEVHSTPGGATFTVRLAIAREEAGSGTSVQKSADSRPAESAG
jgi:two-component system, NtrC family, sensor kinase